MDKLYKLGPTHLIMRPKGRSPLDYLTQRFINEPELEAQFNVHTMKKNTKNNRFWALFCCVVLVPLSVYETLVNLSLVEGNMVLATESWVLRVVAMLAGVGYGWVSYQVKYEAWMQWLTAGLFCVEGMVFIYMAIEFNDYQSSYGIGILLILLCIPTCSYTSASSSPSPPPPSSSSSMSSPPTSSRAQSRCHPDGHRRQHHVCGDQLLDGVSRSTGLHSTAEAPRTRR